MVSWLFPAIFRAACAAYTAVSWMLLGCTGGGVDTTELLEGGWIWVCRSVTGRRSGSNIYSVSTLGVATLYCTGSCCLRCAESAGRSSRLSMVISPAGACVPWDSFESLLEWAAGPLVSIR